MDLVKRGYSTGTFDLLSMKHLELLRMMKQRCNFLTIGLVSDALGEQQKRVPLLPFAHRRALLEHCRWVDEVVEHNGDDKLTAWSKLHFDILFIGDDYYGKEEYEQFERQAPNIPVVYLPLPHPTYEHTTDMIRRLEHRYILHWTPLHYGVGGMVWQYRSTDCHMVIKSVMLGQSEYKDTQTPLSGNVYRLSVPPPRNWKQRQPLSVPVQTQPNLTGVNGWREILVHREVLRDKYAWNPVFQVRQVYENCEKTPVTAAPVSSVPTSLTAVTRLQEERAYPVAMYWLYQQHAGVTLDAWLKAHHDEPERVRKVWSQLEQLWKDLKQEQLVHGDVHPFNLCVQETADDLVSLIDFGWCYHHSFALDKEEVAYYRQHLENRFDEKHFYQSLAFLYQDRYPWYVNLPLAKN
jgi:glycerol-3-phosphate cytidylyltransferase